jgi:hypothetical protein
VGIDGDRLTGFTEEFPADLDWPTRGCWKNLQVKLA